MTDNSPSPAASPAPVAVTWDDFVETCQTLGDGTFIATVHGDGRPHLAWVVPGFADGKLWFSTYRSSQKSINLRRGSDVALHWLQRPDALALCRATARLIDDPAESSRLWESGPLPYVLRRRRRSRVAVRRAHPDLGVDRFTRPVDAAPALELDQRKPPDRTLNQKSTSRARTTPGHAPPSTRVSDGQGTSTTVLIAAVLAP